MENLKNILDNSLLLIESPGKIKIFEKYIGKISKTCTVLSSYGHICNLKPEKSSVDVADNFKMTWENTAQSKKALPAILAEAKKAKHIIIATDPDREGEAIGWHIVNYLKKQKISKPIYRVLFHALTQTDIYKALESPSEMRQDLIDAYLARLSLDFLVGFNISPLLWRKLPGCASAGRVQSTALRNIVELEYKIVQFKSQAYYHVLSKFKPAKKTTTDTELDSKLIAFPAAKISGYCVYHTESQLKYILEQCQKATYAISDIYKTTRYKHSPAPFITSTLQQDASSKLKLSPKQTMQIAQKLYEGVKINGELLGLITYMRTDNVKMSDTALTNCRDYISKKYPALLSTNIKHYKNNAKNTQEAHECIRPTDFELTPEKIRDDVSHEMYILYSLIWKRAVASQMKDAMYEDNIVEIASEALSANEITIATDTLNVSIDVKEEESDDETEKEKETNVKSPINNLIIFQTKHTVLTFAGWLTIYNAESSDASNNNSTIQPQQSMNMLNLEHEIKHTHPPARYTAASLIARMEKLGIGRPGTYTNMIDTLILREYVQKIEGYLKPTQKSWFLIAFLEQYFTDYVQYDFTADMEERLDQIAQGQLNWISTMQNFWQRFDNEIEKAAKSKYEDMQPFIANLWHSYFFKNGDTCQKCQAKAVVRFWKGNGFLACSNYPECNWTSSIEVSQTTSIAEDPATHQKISILTDQYNNTYLQWAATESHASSAVKIPVNLKDEFSSENFSIEKALKLKSMPFALGKHPETGNEILLGIGKFGPYIKYDGKYTSVKSNPLSFTLEDAVKLLAKPFVVRKLAAKTAKETKVDDSTVEKAKVAKTVVKRTVKATTVAKETKTTRVTRAKKSSVAV